MPPHLDSAADEHRGTTTALELAERLFAEGLLGAAAVAKLFPPRRGGRPVCASTVSRWCLDGFRRPDGTVVRLEHVKLAGKLATSRAAVVRFIAAQSDDPEPSAVPAVRSPARRQRDSERAAAELDRLGVGVGRKPR